MFNLNQFISRKVICRDRSLFRDDIEANRERLLREIKGARVLVIGGAGSIGSSFINAILEFQPSSLVVADINENGLAELTRSLRSNPSLNVPDDYRTYTLNFSDPIFERVFRQDGGYDIIANFSAHKHVRSEKDRFSVQALLENNDIKAKRLLDLLASCPPRHFFCVSTDKAANPVNIMGASKRIMEDLIMAYSGKFKVTTARFANVAFSNGSLPDGWIHRLALGQPLAAPNDVLRYFVSPEESGQICLLACILGASGEIFFPRLGKAHLKSFSGICSDFLNAHGLVPEECPGERQAKDFAAGMPFGSSPYPVVYSGSDTTGEKPCEEFFTEGEETDLRRFKALGVITNAPRRPIGEIEDFFGSLEAIFAKDDFTKEEVVSCLRSFIPTFTHEEKGRSLDQKM